MKIGFMRGTMSRFGQIRGIALQALKLRKQNLLVQSGECRWESLIQYRGFAAQALKLKKQNRLAQSEECRWEQFFEDPSMWWDNRKNKRHPDQPDFVHSASGERLWIESSFRPVWTTDKIKTLESPPSGLGELVRARYRYGEGPLLPRRVSYNLRNGVPGESSETGKQKKAGEYTKLNSEAVEAYRTARDKLHQNRAALKACTSSEEVERIHTELKETGDDANVQMATKLVDAYARAGKMLAARKIFNQMPTPDVGPWNSMIRGYARTGDGEQAVKLFERMIESGLTPNPQLFVLVLKTCGTLVTENNKQELLLRAKRLHAEAVKCGHESNLFVANTLIDLYAKCGSMESARKVFDRMAYQDIITWNAILSGYVQAGENEVVLELFSRLQKQEFTPNGRTFLAAVNAISNLAEKEGSKDGRAGYLEKGRAIHDQLAKMDLESDVYLGNALVVMYNKCGSIAEAKKVFEKINPRTAVSWNAIIAAYAQNADGGTAMRLLQRMKDAGFTPDSRTYVAALQACGSLGVSEEPTLSMGKPVKAASLEKGKKIHMEIRKSQLDKKLLVASSLVDMYIKCGSLEDARRMFDMTFLRDVALWNVMILGYAQGGEPKKALDLFSAMQAESIVPNARTYVAAVNACAALAAKEDGDAEDGKVVKKACLQRGINLHNQLSKAGHDKNGFVGSSLVDMYVKCGSLERAKQVFDKMKVLDVVLWNVIILGHAQAGESPAALDLFKRMKKEGFIPDAATYVAVLKACTASADLEAGKDIHEQIRKAGVEKSPAVASSLVEFYSKCGCMDEMQASFDSVPEKDRPLWSSLISAYSQQGKANQVLEIFEKMRKKKLKMDQLTLLSVLNACSKAGLIEKAREYFDAMTPEFGIRPSRPHYSCMIEMYCRDKQLGEAQEMLRTMPFKPDRGLWYIIKDFGLKGLLAEEHKLESK